MRKTMFFLGALLVILSCKDGEIEVPAFTFEDSLYSCGDYTLHRRNTDNTKAIILTLDNTDLPSASGTTTLAGTTSRTVLYRIFDSAISSDYFCAAIPPSSPQVVEEWQGTSFTLTVETIEDTTTTPVSYHHTITLNDLVLERNGVQEVFETFYLGVVDTE